MNSFYISEKSANGKTSVSIDTKLFESRNIYLEGEINAESALLVVKQLQVLNLMDTSKPINLFINSPGGEIVSGMMVYDAMQDSICPVNTICLGSAFSMGAVLVACGSGKRYMLPHSKMMLHEPLITRGAGGSASSIQELSESINKTKKAMNELLAKHTGQTVKAVTKAASYDHFYSAEEALNFGLVDEIVNFSKFLKED